MKKAQVAMEFMATYGWAIIVILGAVSAMAYFGILNPQAFMPDKTTFQGSLANLDNAVLNINGHSIEVAFQNNKGSSVIIPKTGRFISDKCSGGTIDSVTDPITHADMSGVPILNGQKFRVKWNCTPASNAKAGDKITADVVLDYKNLETGQNIKQSGNIEAKWK